MSGVEILPVFFLAAEKSVPKRESEKRRDLNGRMCTHPQLHRMSEFIVISHTKLVFSEHGQVTLLSTTLRVMRYFYTRSGMTHFPQRACAGDSHI